ncbi:MAG: deoxyribose-phosphate aldolase [Clostridiales bacterium]|nr:deoxyribose-phosphate aldolase [Clostridiales bacterium]
MILDRYALARMIDQTLLKPFVSDEQLLDFCKECAENHFVMAAINSAPVALCHQALKDTDVHVGAAIGFPLGQTTISVKQYETKKAIEEGADEIDYVVNIGKLKSGRWDYIEEEMRCIVDICKQAGRLSKVIFENCYLTDEEKMRLCEIALLVRPDYIKTSTGFGTGGATIEDVRLMKRIVGDKIGVKAAGGIRSLDTALAMIEAGASRIGTSAGVTIINELV